MRISDWSSDVCSSDLALAFQGEGRLVDDARLRAVDRGSGEWIVPAAGYSEQRFSPHAQINVDTVKRLGLAWYADLGTDRGVEATPIVVDRILYNITPWNVTTAYDAVTEIGRASCRERACQYV